MQDLALTFIWLDDSIGLARIKCIELTLLSLKILFDLEYLA